MSSVLSPWLRLKVKISPLFILFDQVFHQLLVRPVCRLAVLVFVTRHSCKSTLASYLIYQSVTPLGVYLSKPSLSNASGAVLKIKADFKDLNGGLDGTPLLISPNPSQTDSGLAFRTISADKFKF